MTKLIAGIWKKGVKKGLDDFHGQDLRSLSRTEPLGQPLRIAGYRLGMGGEVAYQLVGKNSPWFFMLTRWFKCILMLALILLLQGPAMLTQELAWAQMLIAYTQERGVVRGVVETFDGQHPCKMCGKAEEMRKAELETEMPQENRQERSVTVAMAWAQMLPVTMLSIRDIFGSDLAWLSPPRVDELHGCGREEPVAPPPRWA